MTSSALANATPLLASQGLSRAFQSHFERSASLSCLLLFVGVLGLIAGLWAVVHVLEQLQSHRQNAVSRNLFEELVHAHGLRGRDLELVRQVARLAGYGDPAYVFVRPDAFDSAAETGEIDRQRLAALKQRLF